MAETLEMPEVAKTVTAYELVDEGIRRVGPVSETYGKVYGRSVGNPLFLVPLN